MPSAARKKTTVRWIDALPLPRAAAVMAMWAASALASAAVTYTATDLADTLPGQDQWRYTYTISAPLPLFHSVNLLFSPLLYADLAVSGSSSGLSPAVSQPDTLLPADGQLTVTATSGIPVGATETVDLDFIWLGGGVPGSQPYELLDDGFSIIEPSPRQTRLAGSLSIPEPASLGLLALGLLLLPSRRHAANHQSE